MDVIQLTPEKSLDQLENRINYRFNNIKLLDNAVTHSSYVKEHGNRMQSNERLEFLGDAFFDAIIGEELFRLFENKEEGFLSQMRAALVCENSLAKEATRLGIGDFLKLGKGEARSGGRQRKSILADAMEAIMGAIYLDSGFEAVKGVVLAIFEDALRDVENGIIENFDYKTALQEELQKNGNIDIKYIVIKEEGPDHDKTFTVQLEIDGEPKTIGTGKSKKKSEQQAARKMMENL